jgi:hypothetical protein
MTNLRRLTPFIVLLATGVIGCEGLLGDEESSEFTLSVSEAAIVTEPFAVGDTVDGWVATLAGVRIAVPIRVRNGMDSHQWLVSCPRLSMRLSGGDLTLGTICANAGGTDEMLDPGEVLEETVVLRACFGDDVEADAAGCSHFWTGPENLTGTYRASVWRVDATAVMPSVNLTAVSSGTFALND